MRSDSFQQLAPAEILRREPGPVRPPVPPAPLLPVHELSPEVFERLVLEYIWFVEAARDVHVYGRRGQRQYGLDIVGDDRSGKRLVCQVRRVKTLTPKQLRDAVFNYAGPPRGRRRGGSGHRRRFAAKRFWFATSLKVDEDTRLVETIVALRDEYKGDLEIEVIGAERLSQGLHDAVGIVAAFFGPDWARAFCGVEPPARPTGQATGFGLLEGPLGLLGLDNRAAYAEQLEEAQPSVAAEYQRANSGRATAPAVATKVTSHDPMPSASQATPGYDDRCS